MSHRWLPKENVPFGMDLRVFGMEVPEGGSSCAKCKFVDGQNCTNPGFIEWNKGKREIPEATDRYCCNNFKAKNS